MITINKTSCLDAPIKVDALNGVAFTREQGAHKFVIACYQNGEKLNLSGTITGKFTCHGRTVEVALDYAGIDTDGNAWVILSQHCYDYSGRFQLAIFNTVDDTTFCIYACVGNIQSSQIGDPVDGGEIIDTIDDLIEDIQEAVASIPPNYTDLVGRVTNIENVFDESGIVNDVTVPFTWESGGINNSGQERSTAGNIRTVDQFIVNSDIDLNISFVRGSYSGIILKVCSWDAEDAFTLTSYSVGDRVLHVLAGTKLRFNIAPSSGSSAVLDPNDGNDLLTANYESIVNITPDTTLAVAGRSADSKAVGDALEEVGSEFERVDSDIEEINDTISGLSGFDETISANWQKGNISRTGTNTDSSSTKIIRTATPWIEPSFSKIYYEVPEGYYLRIIIRNVNNSIKTDTDQIVGNGNFGLEDGEKFRLTLRLINGDDIDLSTAVGLFKLYGKTPIRDRVDDLSEISERNTLISYVTFSMFEKFGVVGDSFASGSLHHPDDGHWTDGKTTNLTWPKILARKTGTIAADFAHGGRSTKTWLTDSSFGLPALLAAPAQQLYIIALGINDNTQINAGTLALGTIEDVNIADYTQNPDTFFGCYGRIIGNIKAHAPYAKIVCLSVARPQERGMDQYIRQIAEKYGLPFIDLTSDPYFTSTIYYGSMVSSHPIAYGYAGMATAIERLILLDILNNTTYWGTYYGLTGEDDSGDPDE